MGFRLDRTYVLQFEGAMEGAYVKIKATPVAVALKLRGSLDVAEVADLMTTYVQEWNLDGSDGRPLPITAEAIVNDLEQAVIAKIAVEWYKAAVGLTAPLDPPEEKDVEPDIPMEPMG